MKVAVVGATGMVGTVILNVLEERNFPVTELLAVASARSVGKKLQFKGEEITVIGLEDAVAAQPDIALFSAGGATSLEWAPKFAAVGTRVIDNSSAWRMDAKVPLVVPEVNAEALRASDTIIANPNCSTIQMVTALGPVHQKYGIRRLVISTYQSITGTGVKAVQQLEDEMQGTATAPAYPHQIHKNALPHCDVFQEAGYTKEELKLVNETHKILNDSSIGITATAVRIPVIGGHSEAVNVELNTPYELKDLRQLFQESPGVVLEDVPEENSYPMPITAEGKDEVFVGRIRRDHSNANTFNAWIVADNLRKGAATNTVQIAEYLVAQGWV